MTLGKEKVRENGHLKPTRKANMDFTPIDKKTKQLRRNKSKLRLDVTTGIDTVWYQCGQKADKVTEKDHPKWNYYEKRPSVCWKY